MIDQLANRLDVLLGAFFDESALERPAQIEHRPVFQRLFPDEQISLEDLRATRSAGQPTKLSTTTRSPADVEIALRDVPRSMPTVKTSLP